MDTGPGAEKRQRSVDTTVDRAGTRTVGSEDSEESEPTGTSWFTTTSRHPRPLPGGRVHVREVVEDALTEDEADDVSMRHCDTVTL